MVNEHGNVPMGLTVIKASAGAGKTYTLAKLYIECLLWGDKPGKNGSRLRPPGTRYHEHILAITFTNKATDEMKSRIVKELHNLSIGKSDYMSDFVKGHGDSRQAISDAARQALEEILFNYTGFQVSTIDAFFQQILRTFARELDQDYNYELQLDSEAATQLAIRGFMAELGTGKGKVDTWVKQFISNQVKTNGAWDFFGQRAASDLARFAKVINAEVFRAHHDEITRYLSDIGSGHGLSKIERFKQSILEQRDQYIEKLNKFPDDFRDFLNQSGLDESILNGRYPLVKLLRLSPGESLGDSVKTLKKQVADEEQFAKNFKKGKAPDEAIQDCIRQRLRDYLLWQARATALDALERNIWKLGLLGTIDDQLTKYRHDNNSILIEDTNELIAKVIDSGVPFVYERAGTWINHFMIDEFQDTSRKQYDNFRPLLENSIGDGNGNLVIGDEKQCIYRFRQSDPNLLHSQLHKDFSANYRRGEPLETNYRSFKHVIGFNNMFFNKLIESYTENEPALEGLAETYENLHQKVSSKYAGMEQQGYVRVNYVYSGSKSPRRRDALGNELQGRDQILDILPGYILALHHERHFEFRDILILVSSHSDGNAVVQRLLEHNVSASENERIDIVSSESLLLKNSPAVRLIMSVLRLIDSTQYHQSEEDADAGDTAGDANSMTPQQKIQKRRLSDQYRYKVLHEFVKAAGEQQQADLGQLLMTCFDNNVGLRKKTIDEQIDLYAQELSCVMPDPYTEQTSLVGLVDKIVREYLEGHGLAGGAETAFLMEFQNRVIDFCNQRNCGGTVHEFIKFWNSKSDKLAVAAANDDNAVRVMTIHASKGLEAPCVIIPFANWPMRQPDKIVWVERDRWLTASSGQPFLGISQQVDDDNIVPPLIPVDHKFLSTMAEFAQLDHALSQEDLIDKVNKTYVAFTRPQQQLHIFAQQQGGSRANDTIFSPLHDIVPELEGVTVHCWSERHPAETAFAKAIDYCELGSPENRYPAKDEANDAALERVEMPHYVVHSALPLLQVSMPDNLSAMQDEGKRLHRLFSLIKKQGDERRALKWAEKRRLFDGCPAWTREKIERVIAEMYENPETAPWFDPQNRILNERPIMIEEHDGADHRVERPDRVVVRPDGTAIVIDYKFGDAVSKEQQQQYDEQVSRYMRLLHLAGYAKVEGYLWYMKSGKIVTVAAS